MNQNITSKERHDDKPHEECGVFGVYGPSGNDVATAIYYGLFRQPAHGTGNLQPYRSGFLRIFISEKPFKNCRWAVSLL